MSWPGFIRGTQDAFVITAVVITHDIRHVADFTDRVVMLDTGRVAATVPAVQPWTSDDVILPASCTARSR